MRIRSLLIAGILGISLIVSLVIARTSESSEDPARFSVDVSASSTTTTNPRAADIRAQLLGQGFAEDSIGPITLEEGHAITDFVGMHFEGCPGAIFLPYGISWERYPLITLVRHQGHSLVGPPPVNAVHSGSIYCS